MNFEKFNNTENSELKLLIQHELENAADRITIDEDLTENLYTVWPLANDDSLDRFQAIIQTKGDLNNGEAATKEVAEMIVEEAISTLHAKDSSVNWPAIIKLEENEMPGDSRKSYVITIHPNHQQELIEDPENG